MTIFEKLKKDINEMTIEQFSSWYLKEQLPYCSICENKDASGVCLHTDCTQILTKYLEQEDLTSSQKKDIMEIPQIGENIKEEKKEE